MEENKFNSFANNMRVGHLYKVECYGPDGQLKWEDGFENLVTTVGLNKYLDMCLKTGTASPAWFIGLKNSGAPAAGDTMSSHASWTENSSYTEANRVTFSPATAASASTDNSATKGTFSINAAATIWGAFLCDSNSKGGTPGVLLGAGDFTASKVVGSGDVLNVTVTCSMTST